MALNEQQLKDALKNDQKVIASTFVGITPALQKYIGKEMKIKAWRGLHVFLYTPDFSNYYSWPISCLSLSIPTIPVPVSVLRHWQQQLSHIVSPYDSEVWKEIEGYVSSSSAE